jgi:hypothetical protein
MRCHRFPGGVFCTHGDGVIHEIPNGISSVWRFEFSDRFGPVLVGKDGVPLKTQPSERSWFWPAFEKWLRARRATEPPSTEKRLEIR